MCITFSENGVHILNMRCVFSPSMAHVASLIDRQGGQPAEGSGAAAATAVPNELHDTSSSSIPTTNMQASHIQENPTAAGDEEDTQLIETQSDAMDVDAEADPPTASQDDPEQRQQSQSAMSVVSDARRSVSRTSSEPREHPGHSSTRSPTRPPMETQIPLANSPGHETKLSINIDHRVSVATAEQLLQTIAPSLLSQPPQEKHEDAMMMTPTSLEPPLPLARLESQQSHSDYRLSSVPSSGPSAPAFTFKEESADPSMEVDQKPVIASPAKKPPFYTPPTFTLPPLSALPVEYHKKGKSKQSRKRDKERGDGKAQDWAPMGIAKWGAVIRANPVY